MSNELTRSIMRNLVARAPSGPAGSAPSSRRLSDSEERLLREIIHREPQQNPRPVPQNRVTLSALSGQAPARSQPVGPAAGSGRRMTLDAYLKGGR